MKQAVKILIFLALFAILPQAAQGGEPEIAFGRDGIGIMNRDGSNVQWIHETGAMADWAPDGRNIVFADNGILRIDLDTLTPTVIMPKFGPLNNPVNPQFPNYGSVLFPVWSPVPGVHEIAAGTYIYDLDGIGRSAIVATDEWGNDGVDLLYVSYQPMTSLTAPAWSPDGTQIATIELDKANGIHQLVILDSYSGALVVPPIPLAGVTQARDPDWSRDGTRIAFTQGSPRQEVLVSVFDLETETITPIINGWYPSWSPDDTQLIFSTFNGKIKRYTFATGAVETLGAGKDPAWRRHVDLSCTSHADCEPGELCCDGSCATPECVIPSDCDDGDICTIGECLDPGSCNAFCDTTYAACGLADGCCGPDCDYYTDPDCPQCVPTHSKEKGPRCSDGIDNDCDGLIDGADPDCG